MGAQRMDGSLTASRVRAVNPGTRVRLTLTVLLLALSGCTGGFFYNRLDFIIPLYFGQRVTLGEAQEAQLKQAVQGFTRWHRQSQLHRYSEFARSLATNAKRPSSRTEIEAAARQMEGFWDDLMVELLPEGTQWLQSLSPQQVDELLGSYKEDDEEDREKWCELGPDKLLQKRIKSLSKSVKHWSGTLNDSQVAIIERNARAMQPGACPSLENRARWRADVRKELANSDRASLQSRLKVLVLEPERSWTEDYRLTFEHNRSVVIDMVAELDGTWTDKQRQSIAARLTDIADDLEALSKG